MSFIDEEAEDYDPDFDGYGDTQDPNCDERPREAGRGDRFTLQPIDSSPNALLFGTFTGFEFDGYVRSLSYDLNKRTIELAWCADVGEAHLEIDAASELRVTLNFSRTGYTFVGTADVSGVWNANIVDGNQNADSRGKPVDYAAAAQAKEDFRELEDVEFDSQ